MVISFDYVLDNADLGFAYQVGQAVINMYPDYQSVFVVHEDKCYLHIHIVFNNCSINPDKENLTGTFNRIEVGELVEHMIDKRLGI